jgi:hypothetical protein
MGLWQIQKATVAGGFLLVCLALASTALAATPQTFSEIDPRTAGWGLALFGVLLLTDKRK